MEAVGGVKEDMHSISRPRRRRGNIAAIWEGGRGAVLWEGPQVEETFREEAEDIRELLKDCESRGHNAPLQGSCGLRIL